MLDVCVNDVTTQNSTGHVALTWQRGVHAMVRLRFTATPQTHAYYQWRVTGAGIAHVLMSDVFTVQQTTPTR